MDIAFRDFDGGNLEFPQLGVKINLKPPGVVIMRSWLLWHRIDEVTRGLRYSMASFTHLGMVDLKKLAPEEEENS